MTKEQFVSLNVMAPLLIADPSDLNSPAAQAAWQNFALQLKEIKSLGAQAVSTDVWWGLVEPSQGQFDWRYYERLSKYIRDAGLKWIPILSFHQCGGNVGDDVSVMLPAWVWPMLAAAHSGDDRACRFVSEQGNSSSEYVSVWASSSILASYKSLMRAFQAHFADAADFIAELNISLGPSGELRYPSYNSHDKGTDYPSRGALQAYSSLARRSFHDFIMKRYGDMSSLDKAWGKALDSDGHKIEPPRDPGLFFRSGACYSSQYGRDFFDWYNSSLIEHGRLLMQAAIEIFAAEGSAFCGIDIGAKIPGVHWRMGSWQSGNLEFADRGAELAAGLILSRQDSWTRFAAYGYQPVFQLFSELSKASGKSRIVLHFTCLEMPDGGGSAGVNSLAYSLVSFIGAEAARLGIPIKGENALSFHLFEKDCWDRMRSHLSLPGNQGHYEGICLLRMTDILSNPLARREMQVLSGQLGRNCHAA